MYLFILVNYIYIPRLLLPLVSDLYIFLSCLYVYVSMYNVDWTKYRLNFLRQPLAIAKHTKNEFARKYIENPQNIIYIEYIVIFN